VAVAGLVRIPSPARACLVVRGSKTRWVVSPKRGGVPLGRGRPVAFRALESNVSEAEPRGGLTLGGGRVSACGPC
jgi:hypothetical protein